LQSPWNHHQIHLATLLVTYTLHGGGITTVAAHKICQNRKSYVLTRLPLPGTDSHHQRLVFLSYNFL